MRMERKFTNDDEVETTMSVIRLHPECIRCMLDKQLAKCPADAPKEVQLTYMQKILSIASSAPYHQGAPVMLDEFHRLQREMFGLDKDFTQIKKKYNAVMLSRVPEMQKRIDASGRPLETAIQYAMIGNYIDFGAKHEVTDAQLDELLSEPAKYVLDEAVYQALNEDLQKAKKLVYLTDNCGEIVMDKLLVQEIRKAYPHLEVTVVVRGEPVSNDATMEDAQDVGMPEVARVIGNGNGVAGTHMDALSPEARGAIDAADVLIAKGQANFETLNSCGLNIYYVFMCKCDMFAKRFKVPRFSGIMVNDANIPAY